MIVYSCTNKITKAQYIGITSQTLKKRMGVHKYNALIKNFPNYFYRAIRKYGWENFEWAVVEKNVESYQMLLEKEVEYIKKYNTFNNGYNMTLGGNGAYGFKHSQETKNKISNSSKGILKGPMAPDHYDKVSRINKSKIGKTYEELYGEQKALELKQKKSELSKNFHSSNNEHKQWLKSSYDEKYGERSRRIKLKMSQSHKNNLINGKRIDISSDGFLSMRASKLADKNPQYIKIDEHNQQLIIDLYKKYGKIVPKISQQSGYSKHVIKRFLKEINLYAGRKKYKNGDNLEK